MRLGRLCAVKDLIDRNMVAGDEDSQFMNASLVYNPTIPHKTGMGVFVHVKFTDWIGFRTLVVDPESVARRVGLDTAFHGPDRARAFAELDLTPKFDSANGKLPGNYRVGTWYQPHPKAVYRNTLGGLLAPRSRSGDMGFYIGIDQMVWKETDDEGDKQGVSVFARYGYAHGDVNRFDHFWSFGGQYTGLIPGRDKDTLGSVSPRA